MTDERQRRRIIESQDGACAWCHRQVTEFHVHHVEPKGMGGRHGQAKKDSESDANKQALCYVCHAAADHQRAIVNGFSCRVCLWKACEHRVA